MKKLKIAVIAPPWLSLYPGCYYGIENVVHNLVEQLSEQGHHVELFTVGGSKSKAAKIHWYHKEDQYKHIHRPMHEVISISISHILYSLNIIRKAGDFDLIHDHNSFIGPAVYAYSGDLPPVLHTLHEPFTDLSKLKRGVPDNRLMFDQFKHIKNLYFNAVSEKQKEMAPVGLQPRIKKVIYNAVNLSEYLFCSEKQDYFTIVASISPDKGQAIAAKACVEIGAKLKIAGTIGGSISTPIEAEKALASPDKFSNDRYFEYFASEVSPNLKKGEIEYIGKINGLQQKKHFAKAKALLFPIQWEEPFGMAVIEALASGTPVVAYKRGAMPEIIQHGVNGFLANNYEEFVKYLQRIDEIDPYKCRQSVEDKFEVSKMADSYVTLYRSIIKKYWKLRIKNFWSNNLIYASQYDKIILKPLIPQSKNQVNPVPKAMR